MTQTVTDLDAQVAALTQRLADARRTRARVDAERDAAEASRDRVLASLTQDFGVTNPEEARVRLAQLEGELQGEVKALTEALTIMEGQG